MAFEIEWTIGDQQWSDARVLGEDEPPGGAFDRSLEALDELLPGWIRFRRDGRPMEPVPVLDLRWADFSIRYHGERLREQAATETILAQEYGVWVAEFAWQLANALNVERFETAPDGADAWYQMFDEPLTLRFHKAGGIVAILSDQLFDHGWMLVVPQEEFFRGARRFLGSVAVALSEHVPVLLKWETFGGLLPYLEEARETGSQAARPEPSP